MFASPTPSRRPSTVGPGVGHIVDGPWAAHLSIFTGRTITLVRCDRPGGTRAGNPGEHRVRRIARRIRPPRRGWPRRHPPIPDAHRARGRRGARRGHLDRPAGRHRRGGPLDHQAGRTLRDHDPESRRPARATSTRCGRSSRIAACARASTPTSGCWPMSSSPGGSVWAMPFASSNRWRGDRSRSAARTQPTDQRHPGHRPERDQWRDPDRGGHARSEQSSRPRRRRGTRRQTPRR